MPQFMLKFLLSQAYITCSYGVGYIGYILVAGACFSITGAFVSGRVIYKTGRIPVFLVGEIFLLFSRVSGVVVT